MGCSSVAEPPAAVHHTLGPTVNGPIGPVSRRGAVPRPERRRVRSARLRSAGCQTLASTLPLGLIRNRWNERGSSGALLIDSSSALSRRKSNVCL